MKYKFTIKPRPHQRRGLEFLLKNRGGGLQVPMRWGKTKVAVDFANVMSILEGVERVLVVCPLNVMGVWPRQIEANTPAGIELDWMIVNYQGTYDRVYTKGRSWYTVDSEELLDFDADLIIIDESHNLGNPNAVWSKHTYELARRAKFRVIITGTMFHRKPFYVFGQAKLYDPAIFGTSFSAFKNMIAVFGGYGGYEVLRYQNLKWMMKKLKPWVYMEEYVPGVEPQVNVIPVDLTGDGLHTYLEMEKESIVDVRGEKVVSPIILSKHLRCQMIAGGWLKGEKKYLRVGDDVARAGAARLKDYFEEGIQKVVIGCRFVPEIADAARAAAAAGYEPILFHGKTPKHKRQLRLDTFQHADRPMAFVAQLSMAKEGVDLSAADTMLFWSLSESYVMHDQFSRRIEQYQESRVLLYEYLIPTGTRTEVTYESLQQKQDVAKWLPKNPRLVEKITSKLEDTDEDSGTDRKRGRALVRRNSRRVEPR